MWKMENQAPQDLKKKEKEKLQKHELGIKKGKSEFGTPSRLSSLRHPTHPTSTNPSSLFSPSLYSPLGMRLLPGVPPRCKAYLLFPEERWQK